MNCLVRALRLAVWNTVLSMILIEDHSFLCWNTLWSFAPAQGHHHQVCNQLAYYFQPSSSCSKTTVILLKTLLCLAFDHSQVTFLCCCVDRCCNYSGSKSYGQPFRRLLCLIALSYRWWAVDTKSWFLLGDVIWEHGASFLSACRESSIYWWLKVSEGIMIWEALVPTTNQAISTTKQDVEVNMTS